MGKYRLFAVPSFIEGIARVLDLGCTLNEYNYSITPDAADMDALSSDWNAICGDMNCAVKNVVGS